MKQLTKLQHSKILKHSEHHSVKHIKLMINLMEHGISFEKAHKIAKKFLGR